VSSVDMGGLLTVGLSVAVLMWVVYCVQCWCAWSTVWDIIDVGGLLCAVLTWVVC